MAAGFCSGQTTEQPYETRARSLANQAEGVAAHALANDDFIPSQASSAALTLCCALLPLLLQGGEGGAAAAAAATEPGGSNEGVAEMFRQKATEFFVAGDYAGAVRLYSLAIQHCPRCAAGGFVGQRAALSAAHGGSKKARAPCHTATQRPSRCPLEARPSAAPPLPQQAPTHPPTATTAAPANRRSPLLWGNRAAAQLKLGEAEQALQDARAARQLEPSYAKVR